MPDAPRPDDPACPPEAFDGLVRAALPTLLEVAEQLSSSTRRPPDELVQLGVLGLFRALRRYDPRLSPLAPFVATRARWAIVDGLRRDRSSETLAPPDPEASDPAPDPELRLLGARALSAVRGLPSRERLVLERLYLEDASLGEAARELGISRSRACRLHRQGLARVRAWLEESRPITGRAERRGPARSPAAPPA